MEINLDQIQGVDRKLLEEIVARDKAWANPDKVSEEALILAPKDRKALLAMLEKALIEQLRAQTENMGLRAKLVERLGEIAHARRLVTLANRQRDAGFEVLKFLFSHVTSWPPELEAKVKVLIETWEKTRSAVAPAETTPT